MGFAAEDESAGLGEVDIGDTAGVCRDGGIEGEVAGDGVGANVVEEWDAEEGSGGSAQGLGIVGAHGAFEEDGSRGAEGFSGADDGAGIARVLNGVEDDQKSGAWQAKACATKFYQGDYSLSGFGGGHRAEEAVGQDRERDIRILLEAGFGARASRFGGQDVMHRDIAESFFQQVESLGYAPSLRGEASAVDGVPDVLHQRVGRTRYRRGPGHVFTILIRTISIPQMKRVLRIAAGVAAIALVMMIAFLSGRIEQQSTRDEARHADVILVLGAAEYRGRPSPVFRARLDHALELYNQGLSRLIMTTGGAGGDPVFTEGGVGRTYLIAHGVPSEWIVVEQEAGSTVESTAMAGEIMHRMGLESVIVVSDGYHIFRVKRMLQFRGLKVYGSPRKEMVREPWRERWNYIKQAIGYLLWRAGVAV